MPLSVIISTQNSEEVVERVLKSVTFADEIIVVDLESEDKTVQIAKKYTDKIFSHPNLGYIEPVRNFSIKKASHEWILILDADEEVSSGLRKAIQGVISAKDQADLPDCFYLPRKNIIFDKWIKKSGWWPDYQLRFFRKDHIEWSDKIHSIPITTGDVTEFPAQENLAIIHHNYQTVEQYISRFNRYSSIQAAEKRDDQQPEVTGAQIINEFFATFLSRYFAHQGYDDGVHGVTLGILQSTSDAAAKMKMWQQQGFPEGKDDVDQSLSAIKMFRVKLAYWIADAQVKRHSGLKKWYWRVRRLLLI